MPPKSLIIAPGKAAWVIYIDVVCINYDGNAYDAAVLAVMAALRNSEWLWRESSKLAGKVVS